MQAGARWLLLIYQLPARPAYLRVKVWRRVLRIGAIGLRGSVYVLPRNDQTREDFLWLSREIAGAGGEATVCEASFVEGTRDADVEAMFRAARDADYAALADDVRRLTRGRRTPISADDMQRLRVRLDELIAIDFFGAPHRDAVELMIAALDAPAGGRHVETAGIHGRTWVTRTGIKIDRMACAWLIRRFIDPAAILRWVDPTRYLHAPGELRFDMSAGELTHEGDDCSFETMLRRFELRDPALAAIAEIVHDIDLKDDRFRRPETPGLAHVITGIAAATSDDDQRLARASTVLDDIYAYFAARTPERTPAPPPAERGRGTRSPPPATPRRATRWVSSADRGRTRRAARPR